MFKKSFTLKSKIFFDSIDFIVFNYLDHKYF